MSAARRDRTRSGADLQRDPAGPAARAFRLLGPGLILALGVAFGISGFDVHLATGTRPGAHVIVRNLRAAPPPPSAGACSHLSHSLRSSVAPLAFAANGSLQTLGLADCAAHTLVAGGVQGPIRFSADHRWIAYGAATVIAAGGGQIERPLGASVWQSRLGEAWAWSPSGATLAGITKTGSVLVGAPGRLPRRLEPADWGATQVLFAGSRTLIAVREQAIWRISLDGGGARQIYVPANPRAELRLALAGRGYVVFWEQPFVAAANGSPLFAVGSGGGALVPLASSVVVAPDAVVTCGAGVAAVLGPGRNLTRAKHVVIYSRAWRPRVLDAGIAPSCSSDGTVIAFALGPAEAGTTFGNERRRIYVVRGRGPARALSTRPPRGVSDELPIVSADGRAVTWVRTVGPAGGAVGNSQPYVGQIRVASSTGPPGTGTPISAVGGTEDVYGRVGWADTVTSAR